MMISIAQFSLLVKLRRTKIVVTSVDSGRLSHAVALLGRVFRVLGFRHGGWSKLEVSLRRPPSALLRAGFVKPFDSAQGVAQDEPTGGAAILVGCQTQDSILDALALTYAIFPTVESILSSCEAAYRRTRLRPRARRFAVPHASTRHTAHPSIQPSATLRQAQDAAQDEPAGGAPVLRGHRTQESILSRCRTKRGTVSKGAALGAGHFVDPHASIRPLRQAQDTASATRWTRLSMRGAGGPGDLT